MAASKRINYIDLAKGIAILCVIIGHTFSAYDKGNILVQFIYSFHMPLFFILSGWFAKEDNVAVRPAILKKAKQLLIPYLIINIIKYIIKIAVYGFTSKGLKTFVISLIYANGASGKTNLCMIPHLKIVGMSWFLIALFFCQIIYICLNNFSPKYNISLGMMAVMLGLTAFGLNDTVWLPFSMQPAMGGLVFYYVGHMMRKKEILEKKPSEMTWPMVVIAAFLWLSAILFNTVGMHANSYPGMYSFLGAICGTYFIVQFSKLIEKIPAVGSFLIWCGKNSIYIYAIHAMDVQALKIMKKIALDYIVLPSTKGALLMTAMRIVFILITASLFILIKKGVHRMRTPKVISQN